MTFQALPSPLPPHFTSQGPRYPSTLSGPFHLPHPELNDSALKPKCLQENIGGKLPDFVLGNDPLYTAPKIQTTKAKDNRWDHLTPESFHPAKEITDEKATYKPCN